MEKTTDIEKFYRDWYELAMNNVVNSSFVVPVSNSDDFDISDPIVTEVEYVVYQGEEK